jgi:hypothetical protein
VSYDLFGRTLAPAKNELLACLGSKHLDALHIQAKLEAHERKDLLDSGAFKQLCLNIVSKFYFGQGIENFRSAPHHPKQPKLSLMEALERRDSSSVDFMAKLFDHLTELNEDCVFTRGSRSPELFIEALDSLQTISGNLAGFLSLAKEKQEGMQKWLKDKRRLTMFVRECMRLGPQHS